MCANANIHFFFPPAPPHPRHLRTRLHTVYACSTVRVVAVFAGSAHADGSLCPCRCPPLSPRGKKRLCFRMLWPRGGGWWGMGARATERRWRRWLPTPRGISSRSGLTGNSRRGSGDSKLGLLLKGDGDARRRGMVYYIPAHPEICTLLSYNERLNGSAG